MKLYLWIAMGSSTSNTTCHLKDIQIHKYYNGSDPVTTDPGPTTTNPDLTTTDLKTYAHMGSSAQDGENEQYLS